MLPIIALVGRPNVGKSTLFNALTRTRDALVANEPGLTRDRQYGVGRMGRRPYLVVDTGGLSGEREGIDPLMERQVWLAIEESQHLLFMVDARDGCTAGDEWIAERLRRSGKPITLVINKIDHADPVMVSADFHRLGLGNPVPIAAVHNRGIHVLLDQVLEQLPQPDEDDGDTGSDPDAIRIAIVGRPNVGKSTLINRLLGEERVLAYDQPGTTRDSIFIPLERDGQAFVLIDTAGVRRRSRVTDGIEKFSVLKTLDAIERSHVVFLVFDARQGLSEQDATLAGHIVESGRALVVVINKWDGLTPDIRDHLRQELKRRFPFLDFAEQRFISALHGSGVGLLLEQAVRVYRNATRDLPTHALSEILAAAVQEHAPPLVHGRRIKLRYAHQGGRNPPLIIIHGNQTAEVPNAYSRYLNNRYRAALRLDGTPLRLEFRSGDNPFAGRKNPLTERQIKKRQRLKRFVKRQS